MARRGALVCLPSSFLRARVLNESRSRAAFLLIEPPRNHVVIVRLSHSLSHMTALDLYNVQSVVVRLAMDLITCFDYN